MPDDNFLLGVIVGAIGTLLIVTTTGRRFLLAMAGLSKKEIERIIERMEEKARE